MNDKIFDIAIVGSGLAALALLEELVKDNTLKIALIEAGSAIETKHKNDSVTQWHHPLNECSNNGFGGTSLTWGGRCVDFNNIDFIKRESINVSWPISKDELIPFYGSSCHFLKIGKPIFTTKESESTNNNFSDKHLERWSLPLRLQPAKKRILSNPNVTYFDDHTVSHIVNNADNATSTIYFDENLQPLFAKECIVAAGGIETTRILLKSVNNKHLGKYYQGHISGKIADVVFNNPESVKYGFTIDSEGIYTRNRYQPTDRTILKENILNSAIWLDNLPLHDEQHENAILSFIYLLFNLPIISKFLAPPSIKRVIIGDSNNINILSHIKNCILNFPEIISFSFPFFIRRYLRYRKIPGLFLYSPLGKYALHFHAEQQPVEENKLSLNQDDSLTINYSFTDLDLSSVIKTHHLLDEYLRDNNIGRLEFYGDDISLKKKIMDECKDGIHQIGTARMATTIQDGVVDKDLQVFNLDNVYVLSSATFPTSSQANPTFLLIVFAKRLASHLLKRVDGGLE